MPKDTLKARGWLEEYLSQLDEYERQPSGEYRTKRGARAEELYAWLQTNQDRVRVVVEDLVPDEVWNLAGMGLAWESYQRRHIQRALGMLDHADDLAEHWSADVVIEIDPDALHPWVWDAAKHLWESGHWGEAVEAAAKVLNVKLQEKIGRPDLSGTDLARRSLSSQPPTAQEPRLRVMDDDESNTYQSAQEGAMHLGEAVFMYWRNVLAHVPGGADRQPSLEALGAISTLARLVDSATVETA